MTALTLLALALVDATSTGTLAIPAVMLLAPRVRYSRVLTYLAVIAVFYWALGLGLAAGVIEAASMLPYLAAIGIMTREVPSLGAVAAALVAYTAVMVAPAVALTGTRWRLGARIEGALERLRAFLTRHSANTLAWVMGIIGFLLAVNATEVLLWSDLK